ncbi:MAG: ABC transporter ATP-binding protein [Gammaproteobacteria bacterium]|nr:ABC transporter ATP-binding protein [Gammaproteobacteria bacterium]
MNTVIELKKAGKRYGEFDALHDVSIAIHPGEVVGLLGHNGAGKTTTMKLILGLIEPSAGSISVFGEVPSLRHVNSHQYEIGFLPENVSFYQHLTGKEVLQYFARLKGVAEKEVFKLLDRVGLGFAIKRKVKNYSKGMRQRLGLAQALLGNPRLLILDEPTAGLDPEATREFYCLLDELSEQGVTILISSHVLPGIEGHIDQAIILSSGQLVTCGNLDDLRKEAALPIVIRAYGDWDQSCWDHKMDAFETRLEHINTQQIECVGPESEKLAILRLLMENPGVNDIQMLNPGLESLYEYFNQDVADRGQTCLRS